VSEFLSPVSPATIYFYIPLGVFLGETFDEHSKYVNGAVVSVRNKGDKIGMWLGDATQQESITNIGKKVKERLGIDARVSLMYA
jgi:translation initiation factor 4E